MRRRALVVVMLLVGVLMTGCAAPRATFDQWIRTDDTSATPPTDDAKPPPGGFFALRPVGAFPSLPDDQQAAAMVHHSTWEPRPQNKQANHTVPPSTFRPSGYMGMRNEQAVFSRITGNFTGTTDEIIQWAAAKWGLPDELIRGEAVVESYWYQNLRDATGRPVNKRGFGDFGDCRGLSNPGPYGPDGPNSFGLLQVKWCAMKDPAAMGSGGWPWIEQSTAYAVDTYAAVLRACYEGFDVWLGSNYTAGDLWGCVGRWYSGAWNSTPGKEYIAKVQQAAQDKPWLGW